MKRCSCGWPVPFMGCPTCPPKPMKCPRCGEQVWVDPMDTSDLDEVIVDFNSKVDVDQAVNLGDFKPRN